MEGQDIINIKLIKESDNNDININTNENNIVLVSENIYKKLFI